MSAGTNVAVDRVLSQLDSPHKHSSDDCSSSEPHDHVEIGRIGSLSRVQSSLRKHYIFPTFNSGMNIAEKEVTRLLRVSETMQQRHGSGRGAEIIALRELLDAVRRRDFIQLQTHTNVKQYSPILKKYVNGEDPETYIKQHILKGDASDGVPNVLSPDHTFVEGLRQRPLTKKKIEAWVDMNIDDFEEEVKRNYIRNQKLIDLKMIPENLEKDIMVDFCEAPINDRSKLFPYFTDKRLRELTENIGEF